MVIGGFLSVDPKVNEQKFISTNEIQYLDLCYTKKYFDISSRNNTKYQCKVPLIFLK